MAINFVSDSLTGFTGNAVSGNDGLKSSKRTELYTKSKRRANYTIYILLSIVVYLTKLEMFAGCC